MGASFIFYQLPGLAEQPGRGRKRKYDAAIRHRIAATACSTPPESVGTHWSLRTLARHLGVGVAVLRSVLWAESIHAYPAKEPYIIADNGSSHHSKKTLAWVAKQKRLHLTFTPAHASWLNQIEIWFGILTRKVIRRGIFKSRDELVQRLMSFIETYNQQAEPFQWT